MPQIRANGIHLEYESFGDPGAPAILLIMGLAGQLIHWPDDFCQALVQAGYRVIRYDNRDVGLSTKLDHLGKPKVMRAGLAGMLGLPVKAPYKLDDMARDAVGLLDALQLKTAHVVGASMGGMIGQIVAAKYPERLRSFTCIMSSSGNPRLPKASLRLQLRLAKRPARLDRDSLVAHSMQTWRMIGSPGYRIEDAALRANVERAYDRAYHPPGLARQTVAIIASGSRVPLLRRITAPTLIIHGVEDPLVPVAAAHDLARHIPDVRLELIPGMGHDLPPPLISKIAQLILQHVQGAEQAQPKAAARHWRRA